MYYLQTKEIEMQKIIAIIIVFLLTGAFKCQMPSLPLGTKKDTLKVATKGAGAGGGGSAKVCKSASDCPAGKACIDRVCVMPEGELCERSSDCPEGRICRDGECVVSASSTDEDEECERSSDCPEGRICRVGRCILSTPTSTDEDEECERLSDCPEGKMCRGGRCILSTPTGGGGSAQVCRTASDCPAGKACIGKVCVMPEGELCERSSDCPEGMRCRDGKCGEESCPSAGQVWKAAHKMCCPVGKPRVKTDSAGNKSCVACVRNEHCQYNGELCYRPTGALRGTCNDPTKNPAGVCSSNNTCAAVTEENCASDQVWKAAFSLCCPANKPRVKTNSSSGNKSCVACTQNVHCQNTGEICPHGGIGGQLCGARPASSQGVCGSNNICYQGLLQACRAQNQYVAMPLSSGECCPNSGMFYVRGKCSQCPSGQVWKAAHRKCCPSDKPRVKTDSLGNKSCVSCTANEHCQSNGELCYRPTGALRGTCYDPARNPPGVCRSNNTCAATTEGQCRGGSDCPSGQVCRRYPWNTGPYKCVPCGTGKTKVGNFCKCTANSPSDCTDCRASRGSDCPSGQVCRRYPWKTGPYKCVPCGRGTKKQSNACICINPQHTKKPNGDCVPGDPGEPDEPAGSVQ